MRSSAVRDGDSFVLNGSKTFITNGPFADTTVFICKLDDGHTPLRERRVLSFILDRGMPGFEQSPPLRKMGLHSSPTGQLFLDGVDVGIDRLIGGTASLGDDRTADAADTGSDVADTRRSREAARAAFASERASIAAMALGIIEQCLEVAVDYARTRIQFGRPIGDFQLIQNKLALMEVARVNVQNMLFRYLETMRAGKSLTFAEASAIKLYSARAATEVALDAVQVLGGNGYMAEYHVEQLRPRRQGPADLRRHRRAADDRHRQRPPPPLTALGPPSGWRPGSERRWSTARRPPGSHHAIETALQSPCTIRYRHPPRPSPRLLDPRLAGVPVPSRAWGIARHATVHDGR